MIEELSDYSKNEVIKLYQSCLNKRIPRVDLLGGLEEHAQSRDYLNELMKQGVKKLVNDGRVSVAVRKLLQMPNASVLDNYLRKQAGKFFEEDKESYGNLIMDYLIKKDDLEEDMTVPDFEEEELLY